MIRDWFTQDIGIDLGTANTLIYIKGKGVVLNEPSVIATDENNHHVIAVGREAKEMLGRTPQNIKVVRPLQDGVISDLERTQEMLRVFIGRVLPERALFNRVRIVIGVPSGVTGVEKRSVEEVARQMGAHDVFVLDESMAAAIGVGIPVEDAEGHMIVDIGGGTTDVAVIALGGSVTSTSLRIAGDELDEAIESYMRKNYNLLVGKKTAEQIKQEIGSVYLDPNDPLDDRKMLAKGRDVLTGLPKTVEIWASDTMRAFQEPIRAIMDAIKHTLEMTPPELAADIVKNGVVLAGGGAKLYGLDRLIALETGIKVIVAENALEAVAEGTGQSLSNINLLRQAVLHSTRKYH